MSNEKLKSENYQQFGGINVKSSPYVLGPMEFLDLVNLDFQTPGSLTQRWGATMYVGQTLIGKISSLFEFSRLDGTSFVFFGSSGGMWYGATTGNSQGMSFIGQTGRSFRLNYFQDVIAGGSSNILGSPIAFLPYLGNSKQAAYSLGEIYAGQTLATNRSSVAVLNDNLFVANGDQFYKFDGLTTSFVGLPPPLAVISSADVTAGYTVFATAGNIGMAASTGSYAFYGSWVNSRGFESQIWPVTAVNAAQVAAYNGTFMGVRAYFNIPSQWNPTSMNIYSYFSGTSLTMGSTTTWNLPYTFLANYPLSGSFVLNGASTGSGAAAGFTLASIPLGSTVGGQTMLQTNTGYLPDPIKNSYYPLGFTISIAGATTDTLRINSYIPSILSTYQNRLFLAGFSTAPSTVWFSDTGEPEGYPLENSLEVRTNNADVVTAFVAYSTRLFIFKRGSFHVLSGDGPNNFFLQEVSGQYGALNKRCAIVYGENDNMMFLDRKGLMMFNGAHPEMASFKMQPYFDRMNYSVAITEACMVHDKLRNQVLCSIPIDGATMNNITIVYDYALKAWTTQLGMAQAVLARIQGRNNTENAFFGGYSGLIAWYGASFTSDAGIGFTLSMKTRFLHDMGDSVQKQFRQLFLNIDPPGATRNMQINFYQDYGTSKVLQTTLSIGEFQARLEYGISAKSLAFELVNIADSSPLKIHGFTISERLQRKV